MKNTLISWILQIICAVILGFAVYPKFSSAPESVALFTQLGMEPFGRYLIGVLEAIAVILVLMPQSVGWGALLTWGLMMGATIGHITQIGYEGESLELGLLAAGLVVVSSVLMVVRRHEVPLLGRMFERAEEADCMKEKTEVQS